MLYVENEPARRLELMARCSPSLLLLASVPLWVPGELGFLLAYHGLLAHSTLVVSLATAMWIVGDMLILGGVLQRMRMTRSGWSYTGCVGMFPAEARLCVLVGHIAIFQPSLGVGRARVFARVSRAPRVLKIAVAFATIVWIVGEILLVAGVCQRKLTTMNFSVGRLRVCFV